MMSPLSAAIEVFVIMTDVAPAASVPASPTSMKVLGIAAPSYMFFFPFIPEKSALPGSMNS